MKVYITKYALTKGIIDADAEQPLKDSPGFISVKFGGYSNNFHGEGKEWHRSLASAEFKANQMRLAKIVSMKKQIKKLEEMTF